MCIGLQQVGDRCCGIRRFVTLDSAKETSLESLIRRPISIINVDLDAERPLRGAQGVRVIDAPLEPVESRGGKRRITALKRPHKKSRAPLCGQLIWADRRDLEECEGQSLLQRVNVERASSAYEMARDPSDSAEATFSRRIQLMAPFLALPHLHESIVVHHGLGGLVREVTLEGRASRFLVYNLWSLMCRFGLDAMSLLPHFDRCGAPKVKRPCAPGGRKKAGRKTLGQRIERAFPAVKPLAPAQPGMSEAWRALIMMADRAIPTPKPRFAERYDKIITTSFVKDWRQNGALLEPVIPLGDIPNKAQVRYVLKTEYQPLLRLLHNTTAGHFKRSLRGMRGRSWEGVPGPGHTYAIDATREVGSEIRIRTRRRTVDGLDCVIVRVEDDGVGIPGEIRKRVFDRGFSTRGAEHEGLGLAIVARVVAKYGGRVTIDDGGVLGTAIELVFPLARA